MYDLPGGFLDYQETGEEAVIREIYEELNIKIKRLEYICTRPNRYLYKRVEYQTLDLFYRCYPVDLDNIIPRDDVADYAFISRREIVLSKLAFVSHREAIIKMGDRQNLPVPTLKDRRK